jgi:hypothetical protein
MTEHAEYRNKINTRGRRSNRVFPLEDSGAKDFQAFKG